MITVASWPNGTPNNTTTYEIVLLFKDQDHITAATVLSTNIITELENSATILVDGLYTINLIGTSVVRWNKSETTLVTWDANNRTVTGIAGFWNCLQVLNTKLAPTPNVSYIKCRDCRYGMVVEPCAAVGDATTLHHFWSENTSIQQYFGDIGVLTTNMVQANCFNKNSPIAIVSSSATGASFAQIFEKFWTESAGNGMGLVWPGTTGAQLAWIRDSVFQGNTVGNQGNTGTGKENRASNVYWATQNVTGSYLMSAATTLAVGNYTTFHNIGGGRMLTGTSAASGATLFITGNDIMSVRAPTTAAGIDIPSATSYVSATSDFDYLAGNNAASLQNVDTSASTSSTASPSQYRNLTATRTNPRSSPNFPLAVDNTVVGLPTVSQVIVTFDCNNGALAGQQTAINVDSASGQPVLNVLSSAAFLPGMVVEVGFGTVRQEVGRVSAVGAGTITLEANLSFSHTAAQADVVSPQLRQSGLPFIRYGTVSGVYTMATDTPNKEDWGLFWTTLKTTSYGTAYSWKKIGHSVTIRNLKAQTTYFAIPCAYNPLGQIMVGPEFSFLTASADRSFTFA